MKNLFENILKSGLIVLLTISLAACGGNENTENQNEEVMTEETRRSPVSDTANKTVDGKLNINTATGEAFRTIPDVGDRMVHEFEEYRPYVSIQQFRKEIGKYVDEDRVAAYEEYIYVPIHRNDSDAATLMQIPGLVDEEAEELIAGRPYASNQTFYDVLKSFINNDEMATAKKFMKAG
jgi:DNA uptake protein ComE-like DNA-binding protein